MRDMVRFFFWMASIFGVLMAAGAIGAGQFKMAVALLVGSFVCALISEWVSE